MPKVVLFVDDDDSVRQFGEDLLTDLGYEAVTAANGVEALRVFEARASDAVVTDIRMPGIDGYELAAQFRSLKPELPIVCVSGFTPGSELERHYNVFLRKPFRSAQLASVLEVVLSGAEAPRFRLD
jgi:CheY-like chemotaxis protein